MAKARVLERGEIEGDEAMRTTTRRGQLVQRRPMAPTPLAHRIPEAASMLGVSKSTIWRMVAAGTLEARKIGAATVIPHAVLEAYFEGAPTRNSAQ